MYQNPYQNTTNAREREREESVGVFWKRERILRAFECVCVKTIEGEGVLKR
jgi:hypothetical protein